MQCLPLIEANEITAIARDERKSLGMNCRDQRMVLSAFKIPIGDVRRMMTARVRNRDQIKGQTLVDQEWVTQIGRPAFSQATQASMPSSGNDG